MKVLIADKFERSGVEGLRAIGCDVVEKPDASPDDMPAILAELNPEALVVRSTKVRADALAQAKKLKLIVRAGSGYDNIDVDAASDRGVFVSNCPGKNSLAVAELVWGLILACDRRIPDQTAEAREGRWSKGEYAKNARGLAGRTLGIVGFGRIGREIALRGAAFGMEVVAWSRSLTAEASSALHVRACVSPQEVARQADVISVNVAATAETARLIDGAFCEALRPGAIFVNTSRGSVVDEGALLRAIREKGVRAGLDVFEGEPSGKSGEFSSELVRAATAVTHHVGASTDQAQEAVAEETVRIVKVFRESGEAPNCVNRRAPSIAVKLLTVTHLNRPGVLAKVLGALGEAQINVEEMENIIYAGSRAACARIRVDREPTHEVLLRISNGVPEIISLDMAVIE